MGSPLPVVLSISLQIRERDDMRARPKKMHGTRNHSLMFPLYYRSLGKQPARYLANEGIKEHQNEVQELQHDTKKERQKRKEEINKLEEKIEQLEEEKKGLQNEIQQLRNDTIKEIEKKNKEIHELKEKIKMLEEEKKRLQQSLEITKRRLSNTEKRLETAEDNIKELQKQLRTSEEDRAKLCISEMCKKIQSLIYKRVNPDHYDAFQPYKVKNILTDIDEDESDDVKNEEAKQRWKKLQEKLRWHKKYETAMKSIQIARNEEVAHPDLEESELRNYVTSLTETGWLRSESRRKPKVVFELIDIWKNLVELEN